VTGASVLASVAAVFLVAAGILSWQQEAAPARVVARPALALDRAALFRAKGCAPRHAGPDTDPAFTGLPDLSDAPSWAGRRESGLGAAAYLRESIRDPGVFTAPGFKPLDGPVQGMPTLAVSDAEVDALVAYLLHR
jgi:cytochrome c1